MARDGDGAGGRWWEIAGDGARWRGRWREMAGDGGRWRGMAGDGGRSRWRWREMAACGAVVAAAGRGGVRWQACALAGAAEGAVAWWVKLLQSRYARASSYACTCARGCELVSGGEWGRGRVGQRWGSGALRADSPHRAQLHGTTQHYSEHGSVEARRCWFEARRTSSCASVLLTSVGTFVAHC